MLVAADQRAERAGVTAASPRQEDVIVQALLVRRTGHVEPRFVDALFPTPPARRRFPDAPARAVTPVPRLPRCWSDAGSG
jgi:hypothetical protein